MLTEGVYRFEEGLPGFDQEREFRLVAPPPLAPLLLLESLATPGLRFVCVPPQFLVADYHWEPAGGCALVILTFPADGPPTANLLAPLILDPVTRQAAQVIQVESAYACRASVAAPPGGDALLILRRKAGDAITIEGGIEIRVLEITPTRVLLGIVAPPEVGVLRKEILLARDENRRASVPAAPEVLQTWARIFSPQSQK